MLLARGAAVGTAKNKGATPLSSACGEGHLKVARELLSRGVEVDTARNDTRYAAKGARVPVLSSDVGQQLRRAVRRPTTKVASQQARGRAFLRCNRKRVHCVVFGV